MKIKLLITLFFILTFASLGYSENKSYKIDLNNDGKEEVITTEDRFGKIAEGVVNVQAQDGMVIGSFSMPDRLGEV